MSQSEYDLECADYRVGMLVLACMAIGLGLLLCRLFKIDVPEIFCE